MSTSLISIRGLKKSYFTRAGELEVLKGLDADFSAGEMVSIVGASGAGKSTFLHILGTLDRPTSGEVLFDINGGVQPFSLSGKELPSFRNRVVGFVFQFHYLLPEFSALENVMMPDLVNPSHDTAVTKQKAESLLSDLGLYNRKTHKPGELSGGEQQRVAVARALMTDPRVVLADEPTGNLDSATGNELFRLLMDVNEKKNITFIIVTHNEALSKKCHRTLTMIDGKLN
ncbi:MAG: ABC transporter ATP-binding protein [Dissulfurispiraceae bacterium]|jgi:lipoprotein-releasing system ATP-binding protein|nr:ABC transporter ATP-binding protein [Dissulfurispiraceae bacterium]